MARRRAGTRRSAKAEALEEMTDLRSESAPGSPTRTVIPATSTILPSTSLSQRGEKPAGSPYAPRLLSRRGQRYAGGYNVRFSGERWCRHHCNDPFRTAVTMPKFPLLGIITTSYFAVWFVFAPIYMWISESCDLDTDTLLDALYYSMITMTTIGFGTKSMTFGDCASGYFIIGLQFVVGTIMNAVLMGVLLTRLSRSTTRATSIIFSEHATVRSIRGSLHFMFQIVDTRSLSLSEAHVRCYAIRHSVEDSEPYLFQQHFMRLSHPDDQVGGVLFMVLPTLVVHPIDGWSPLVPPRAASQPYVSMSAYEFPDVLCRANDAESGGRSAALCEICGDSFGSPEDLRLHLLSAAVDDRISGHDLRCVTADSGEVFASVESMLLYTAEEDRVPHTKVSVAEQRRHSHLNHLCAASYYSTYSPDAEQHESVQQGYITRGRTGSCDHECSAAKTLRAPGEVVAKAMQRSADSKTGDGARAQGHGGGGGGGDASDSGDDATARLLGGGNSEEEASSDAEGGELEGESDPDQHDLEPVHAASAPHRCANDVHRADLETRRRAGDAEGVRQQMHESCLEVIVLVEGVDPYTSCTVQARHSYCFHQGEIKFDHEFVPCVSHDDLGNAEVDLVRFHQLRPVGDVEVARSVVAHS